MRCRDFLSVAVLMVSSIAASWAATEGSSGDAQPSGFGYGAFIAAGASLLVALYSGWRTWRLERDKAGWAGELEGARAGWQRQLEDAKGEWQQALSREKSEVDRELQRAQAGANERLARLEAGLALQKSEADARTNYEWHARQRLFEQLEPVLFLTGEVIEASLQRIANLALAAKHHNLGNHVDSWLRGPDNYFFLTTGFRLLRPLACLRLMTERLTSVDFSLDSRVLMIFALMKLYRTMLTDPFSMTRQTPKLTYRYLAPPPTGDYVVSSEQTEYIQHLYLDQLDEAVDSLLEHENAERTSLKSYGTFRAELANPAPTSATARHFAPVMLVFRGFSPETRPVFWRALLGCAFCGKVALRVLKERSWDYSTLNNQSLAEIILTEAKETWASDLYWSTEEAGPDILRAEFRAVSEGLLELLKQPFTHVSFSSQEHLAGQ